MFLLIKAFNVDSEYPIMRVVSASSVCGILAVVLVLSSAGCLGPTATGSARGIINTSGDPVQVTYEGSPISITRGDDVFTLTPRANYTASVVVVRKESYSMGWDSELSPFDAVFAWGELAEQGAERYVTYSQGSRFYFFRYNTDSPFDSSYISVHSSNNHIIPANDNVYAAVRSIPDGEKAVLSGFLVDVHGLRKNGAVSWLTSLGRGDTGKGSCEVFYVTSVRIGNDVFT